MATIAFGAVEYYLEDFLESSSSAGAGITTIDDETYFKTSISPDFTVKSVLVGFDLNLYIPVDFDGGFPEGADVLVLRKLGYDHYDKHGFQWGRLKHMTFGQGLLMYNYDTGSGGSIEFSQNKTGLYAYASIYNTKIKTLYTDLSTKAARIETALPRVELFGAPVHIGATYVEDSDGVDDDVTGATRASQTGYAGDIFIPIAGDAFTVYAEYASLEDYGDGYSTGVRGAQGPVHYKAEYRILNEGFVPSYFDNVYEATSFNFDTDALQEQTSGFLVALETALMNDNILAGAEYEKYDEHNRLSAALGWKNVGPVTGVYNYSKDFGLEDDTDGVGILDFYYVTGKWYDIIGRAKWVYKTGEDDEMTYSAGIQINPDKLFSGFMF